MTTNRRIPLMAGGAALLLLVMWYFLLWAPEMKSLKSAHKAHAQAEQKISDLNVQVGQLHALVKQIPADKARFAQLEAALPENPQLDQALNLMQQTASQSGVVVSSLTPSTPGGSSSASPSGGGGVPAITLNMSVQGGAAQIKAFLEGLDHLPRTVVVDKLALNGGASSTATLTARIFYAGQPTP
jgi:Tfp pilus assembly protein PilO